MAHCITENLQSNMLPKDKEIHDSITSGFNTVQADQGSAADTNSSSQHQQMLPSTPRACVKDGSMTAVGKNQEPEYKIIGEHQWAQKVDTSRRVQTNTTITPSDSSDEVIAIATLVLRTSRSNSVFIQSSEL